MGRFSILDKPLLPPHQCKICGGGPSSGKLWFVDTGTSEEWYGVVYYCNECVHDLATTCGYVKENNGTDTRSSIDNLSLFDSDNSDGLSVLEDSGESDSELRNSDSSYDGESREDDESSNDEGMAELRSSESSDRVFSLEI